MGKTIRRTMLCTGTVLALSVGVLGCDEPEPDTEAEGLNQAESPPPDLGGQQAPAPEPMDPEPLGELPPEPGQPTELGEPAGGEAAPGQQQPGQQELGGPQGQQAPGAAPDQEPPSAY